MCDLSGLTDDHVFVADDSADDIEMPRTHPRASAERNFGDERDSRTAVPE